MVKPPGRARGPGPEFNLVQNPELLHRLTRALGLRQSHIVPTLSETIQPVVIVHDVSKDTPAENYPIYRQNMTVQLIAGFLFSQFILSNPAGSAVYGQVLQIWYSMSVGSRLRFAVSPASGGPGPFSSAFQTNQVHAPFPAVAGLRTSKLGVFSNSVSGVPGSGDWFRGYTNTTSAPFVVNFNQLIIAPGAQLVCGMMDAGAINDIHEVGIEWSELPVQLGPASP